MEMLELHQGSTSISVQIGGDSTDVMFVIVHRSLRVCIHYKHVLAMSDAVCRRASVWCCTVNTLTATPICKRIIVVQLGMHCMKSICDLLKYYLSQRQFIFMPGSIIDFYTKVCMNLTFCVLRCGLMRHDAQGV
jgi:hypothetical protein